jgi:hypothetical protein
MNNERASAPANRFPMTASMDLDPRERRGTNPENGGVRDRAFF